VAKGRVRKPAKGALREPKVLTIKHVAAQPLPPSEKNDVPVWLVLLAGVMIWVLIFGTIFSYAAFYPCSFVTVVIGERATLESLSYKLGLDFTAIEDCRTFLRLTISGPTFVAASAPK
jgi:hypothetical protein